MLAELPLIALDNGLVLSFDDHSNRYFGDYHRICIEVLVSLPQGASSDQDCSAGRTYTLRTLTKMGVPTAALGDERVSLVEDFLATSRGYLEKPDFPQQLLRKIGLEKKKLVLFRGGKF